MIIFASIFHQAQVNGQWKRIRHSQLVQAHIPGHELLKILQMQWSYRADMEFEHIRPYLVFLKKQLGMITHCRPINGTVRLIHRTLTVT